MHPISLPVASAEGIASPQVVLRDGSVAGLRPATTNDVTALQRFFHDLSPDSRRRRFFASGEAPEAIVECLSNSESPQDQITLIAERVLDHSVRIVAVGSYIRMNADSAEVAFAVADAFQGKGLGTALLERLAVLASEQGFRRFVATTLADNAQMLEVFRDSGFEIRSRSIGGGIDVQLSLIPSARAAAASDERDRLATAASLRPLLEPQAVAVVGASRDRAAIGRRVIEALIAAGFTGPIYAVNPHGGDIAGRSAYTSAAALPPGVDLAVITVPSSAVSTVVDDCAAAGVKSLVVITAGFAEAGADGRALQQRLAEQVRRYGMRMVGPNCMGLLNANPAVNLNASFSPVFPPAGHIGLLSQSGALGITILSLAADRRLGLSTFVSVGNKADVSGNDLLEYWEGDASTNVILLYLESFGNPRRFARLARRIAKHKPIVAVKSGRTRAGRRAASSHTAALAASDVAVDALFHQSGVIRADTLDEMFDLAALLDTQPLPRGRRVAIVTNAGGPGILAADACEAAGLTLPEFSPDTRAQLASCLPPMASVANPIDMIASAGPDEYRSTIAHVLAAPEVDAVIVLFTPVDTGSGDPIVRAIRDGVSAGRQVGAADKPVLACVMTEPGHPVPIEVGNERLPAYAFPENAARALGKVVTYAEWRRQEPGLYWGFDDLHVDDARRICRAALDARGDTWLSDEEVRSVLGAFGLPLVAGVVARTADEAAALAAAIGWPVAAKLSSARIQHKSDIGAVRLDLRTEASVRQAFADILSAARTAGHPLTDESGDGVLIQSMIGSGVETMMGISHDPLFGPLIAFGLGGVYVEVLGDVKFRVAPLTDRDVDELLHEIKGFRLLEGYRGHAPGDVPALRDLLLRLSRLADDIPEISELDLNPVIALAAGSSDAGLWMPGFA